MPAADPPAALERTQVIEGQCHVDDGSHRHRSRLGSDDALTVQPLRAPKEQTAAFGDGYETLASTQQLGHPLERQLRRTIAPGLTRAGVALAPAPNAAVLQHRARRPKAHRHRPDDLFAHGSPCVSECGGACE